MTFFSAENPVMILLAGIISFLLLRALLSKVLGSTKFGKKYADFVSAIIVLIGLLMATSITFLKMVAHSAPYVGLVIVFIGLGLLIFLGLGVKENQLSAGLKTFSGNVYLWVLLFLIIAWGSSIIWGPELLEKGETTPLTGFTSAQQEKADNYDFSFIFTKPLLGFLLIFIILGLTFHSITRTSS